MSIINVNLASLQAVIALGQNQRDLSLRLQRLSTGLKINSGADDPAGLIASDNLRSQIAGIGAAIDNSQRADNVLQTADGALGEVSSLLLQLQSLTGQAANTGGLSPDEIGADQLQADSILSTIDRISNSTQFDGVKLLNGQLDYVTSGVRNSTLSLASVGSAQLPGSSSQNVTVQVVTSAKLATLGIAAPAIGGVATSIEIAGTKGIQQISFAASAAASAVSFAIGQYASLTGVSAILSGSSLRLTSTDYGSSQFVSIRALSGTFTDAKTYGANGTIDVNGQIAQTQGLSAVVRGGGLDLNLQLTAAFAQQTAQSSQFTITGGGALFQLGAAVNSQEQSDIGVGSVASSNLGSSTTGFLSSLATGGANSLVSGNTEAAQTIITEAINQVSTLRGRLGAFQSDVIASNVNSLSVALENVTASNSAIRDTDFAAETANLTRDEILVQATTSVLATANSQPQQVLSLLHG